MTLVVESAPTRERKLQLGPTVSKVDGKWDEGKRLLANPTPQLIDLTTVQEQLAAAIGIDSTEAVRILIGRDMGTDEVDLPVLDPGVGILQGSLAKPERLHLGSFEGDPALEGLENFVVVAGAAILGDLTGSRPSPRAGTRGRPPLGSRRRPGLGRTHRSPSEKLAGRARVSMASRLA